MKLLGNKTARYLVLALTICGGPIMGFAQETPAPDNSKTNQEAKDTATADKQSNAASDRDLTQKVRKAIMQDKSMSTYAHNVKVVTQNGQVTLSGPVRSDDEKSAIVSKATEVAGKENVVDQITVAPKNQ